MNASRLGVLSALLVLLVAPACAAPTDDNEAGETADGLTNGTSSGSSSINGARIAPLPKIVDVGGSTWTVNAGVVYRNGAKAAFSAGVEWLLYLNGKIYQGTAAGWWFWNGTGWTITPDPRVTSANRTEIGADGLLVDANHNVWTIHNGVVYENGAPAGSTAKVTNLVYDNGHIWQENSFHNWYEWNGSSWPSSAPPVPPAAAKSVGYAKLAFDSPFSDLKGIDLTDSEEPGFDWYTKCFFCRVAPASAFSIVKDGGVAALRIDGAAPGNSIYTSPIKGGKHGPVGTSFGGGAYFEARIAMGEPVDGAKSWPAFWALPSEDGATLAWPGNSNKDYDDSVELDFMELMPHATTSYLSPVPTIGSTLHDWFGVYNTTCAPSHYCQVAKSSHLSDGANVQLESTPANPVYNTFGALWVPSLKNAKTGFYSEGRIQFYFNDVPYGAAITWTGPLPTNQSVPTNASPWAYSPVDLHDYTMILGTGGNAFMNVQWVHVWQD